LPAVEVNVSKEQLQAIFTKGLASIFKLMPRNFASTDAAFCVLPEEFYSWSGKPKPAILIPDSPAKESSKQPVKRSQPALPCSSLPTATKKRKEDDDDDNKDKDSDRQSMVEPSTPVSRVLRFTQKRYFLLVSFLNTYLFSNFVFSSQKSSTSIPSSQTKTSRTKKSMLTASQQAQVRAEVKRFLDLEVSVAQDCASSSNESFDFDSEQPQRNYDYNSQQCKSFDVC
jgi:hypothetical protein